MRPLSPFTDTGALQSLIYELQNEVRRKCNTHEIYETNRKLDCMERTVREISSSLDGIQHRLQALQEGRLNGA